MPQIRVSLTKVGGAVAAAFLALAAFAAPTAAQEVTLRLHHFVGAVAPPHKAFMAPWAEKVMAESNGRIKIEIYPSMGLGGKPPQLIDQVVDGIVDIIFTLPGYTPGRFPKTETFELPGMNADPITTNLALWDFYQKHLQDEYANMHVLLLHVHAGQVFHMKKPVRKYEDFAGLTIRSPSNAGTLLIEELGANPYHAPVPQIPELLSKGVVDGVMVPFEIVPPFKIHEATQYHVTVEGPRVHTSVFLFAMNKAKYDGLPADLKKVIDDNAGANLAKFAGQVWIDVEGPGEKMARDRGNEFITLGAEDTAKVRAAGERAVQRWIAQMKEKGIDGAALIADARELLKQHAGGN